MLSERLRTLRKEKSAT